MQAIGRQPQRAPDGAPVHYERHRPEQTTLYRLVQQHAATFFAQAETEAGADLPQFVKDEFDAFLEGGILAQGFLRLRWVECGYDKLLAFSGKRRGFFPSCDARGTSSTTSYRMCLCGSGCCCCRSRCAGCRRRAAGIGHAGAGGGAARGQAPPAGPRWAQG